ncbi:MAG: hypothetical protein K6T78_14035 [Alicyclobacillus sp.]|nr:hypothetical protein [Alicyclobacillus sp.]
MPCIILGGALNTNTEQQNSAHCVGLWNLGGWDANQKLNYAKGGTYGICNFVSHYVNVISDVAEVMDGVIFDSDVKPLVAFNV